MDCKMDFIPFLFISIFSIFIADAIMYAIDRVLKYFINKEESKKISKERIIFFSQ